jgi:hypothetical protein
MEAPIENRHVLEQLKLPDRYEVLEKLLGPDVVQILIPPAEAVCDSLQSLALTINSRQEGQFVPVYGESGVGKTTLISNLIQFFPESFIPTLTFSGDVSYESLSDELQYFCKQIQMPNNESRIIPINIDHREAHPPSDAELAEIKRFLRTRIGNALPTIFWPETNLANSKKMAERYKEISGSSLLELPLVAEGPPRETWIGIAVDTMRLVNDIDNLSDLGVDPRNYKPEEFATLGAFLRQISSDFNAMVLSLRKEARKQIGLVIVFVSGSRNPGVLMELTNATKYGLLESHALVAVTPESEIGRWWSTHMNLLTRAIVFLNAHAVHLPPVASIAILRRYGHDEMRDNLNALGIHQMGAERLVDYFGETSLGQYLLGKPLKRPEGRGAVAEASESAFELIAEDGFTYGKDKPLNRVMAAAIVELLESNGHKDVVVAAEQKLSFCPLIPDNSVEHAKKAVCVEYTWRTGNILESGHRSEVSQYILGKLKKYVNELGWIQE